MRQHKKYNQMVESDTDSDPFDATDIVGANTDNSNRATTATILDIAASNAAARQAASSAAPIIPHHTHDSNPNTTRHHNSSSSGFLSNIFSNPFRTAQPRAASPPLDWSTGNNPNYFNLDNDTGTLLTEKPPEFKVCRSKIDSKQACLIFIIVGIVINFLDSINMYQVDLNLSHYLTLGIIYISYVAHGLALYGIRSNDYGYIRWYVIILYMELASKIVTMISHIGYIAYMKSIMKYYIEMYENEVLVLTTAVAPTEIVKELTTVGTIST